jgi:hypothetical protein
MRPRASPPHGRFARNAGKATEKEMKKAPEGAFFTAIEPSTVAH